MNQCVPSRDLKLSSKPTNSFVIDVPSSGYDVAPELTWKNGSLAMYGLSPRQRVLDTLESVVDQATAKSAAYKVVPWLDGGAPATSAATMDALVPCNNNSVGVNDGRPESSTQVPAMGSCVVGSCSGAAAPTGGGWSYASASQSDTFGGREVSLDSYGGGPASTSLWSPENTSSGEDNDFVCPSRSQKQQGGNRKLGVGKSSIYIAKTKAAATHNQSERRRRDKINQRMKTLQKMVPNSSKSDKASMLGEVIEYMKQLQAQVGMMSRMNMMLPLPMQQLQMSMMAAAAMGMAMPPPIMPTAAPFMPVLPWDIHPPPVSAPPEFLPNFFACQSQPTTMDGYRLAALYQQFKQQSSASKF